MTHFCYENPNFNEQTNCICCSWLSNKDELAFYNLDNFYQHDKIYASSFLGSNIHSEVQTLPYFKKVSPQNEFSPLYNQDLAELIHFNPQLIDNETNYRQNIIKQLQNNFYHLDSYYQKLDQKPDLVSQSYIKKCMICGNSDNYDIFPQNLITLSSDNNIKLYQASNDWCYITGINNKFTINSFINQHLCEQNKINIQLISYNQHQIQQHLSTNQINNFQVIKYDDYENDKQQTLLFATDNNYNIKGYI